jgi:hypothetical protein
MLHAGNTTIVPAGITGVGMCGWTLKESDVTGLLGRDWESRASHFCSGVRKDHLSRIDNLIFTSLLALDPNF